MKSTIRTPATIEVQYVKGVGPRRATILHSLGIFSVDDLLHHYPRDYQDRRQIRRISQCAPGEKETVRGKICAVESRKLRPPMTLVQIAVSDGTGIIQGAWFNQPYMASRFSAGQEIVMSGTVRRHRHLQMINPEYELLDAEIDELIHSGRIVPLYPLTEGVTQSGIRRIIREALKKYARHMPDILPREHINGFDFIDIATALFTIHFPETPAQLEKARRRLVFDEFLLMQSAVMLKRAQLRERSVPRKKGGGMLVDRFIRALPFTLTDAQKRVIEEIKGDIFAPRPMNRLLQGDVGSGKTVVAITALLHEVDAGFQAILMVPTELLAEQHYMNLQRLLAPFDVPLFLLTGETRGEERTVIDETLRGKVPCIVVGTHALLQKRVAFPRLGLVIIDEQHRFGVSQRARLRTKGTNPDVLVMTATPIPRTLALTLYGDFHFSVLDRMPPGRGEVVTRRVPPARLPEIYTTIRHKVEKGQQAYIIYPLIEESKQRQLRAATTMAEMLQRRYFSGRKVGLMHGRMEKEERTAIMTAFRKNEIHVLVATSVIEVGLDVPNATLMLIEHAERFGLSQLHQMRGRIGRGRKQSFLFFSGKPVTEESRKRLRAFASTTDGFKIAEMDLTIRGPGEFFSDRQHGGPDFRLGDPLRDRNLLEAARETALKIVRKDRRLRNAAHLPLRNELVRRYRGKFLLSMIG